MSSSRPKHDHPLERFAAPAVRRLPGLALCAVVTLAASALQAGQVAVFGRAWLEALVLAILIGAGVRTLWKPGPAWLPGIAFSGKVLLEIAVVLLGAMMTAQTLFEVGPALLFGVAGVVASALAVSYGLGRLLHLPHKLAVLIACGNSICGNSAIAAVAPVIDAEAGDVAAAISFTAVLGVGVVLGLPLLGAALALSPNPYGVFAGLTVYAVPQVLAATAPMGALAVRIGTLIKLIRVLMLGPVVLALSMIKDFRPSTTAQTGAMARRLPKLSHLLPAFIVGFLGLAAARSAGLIPLAWLPMLSEGATGFTVMSMAALGLGVDVHALAKVGPRVVIAVIGSLAALGAISFALIRGLAIA